MPMKSVCLEAHDLTNGARRESYGHPLDDYTRTVAIFKAWTGIDLTPEQGVKFMICVKQSREHNLPHRENRVDACGYFNCLQEVIAERERRGAESV